jgi:uncharacterized protein (DUF924 family)
MSEDNNIDTVLNFWFHECSPENWFVKDQSFDTQLKERFGTLVDKARAGQLDGWADSPPGVLALILLLDQMTRNIFRDTPDAFSGDEMALVFSLKGFESGYLDHYETPSERQFMLMPMMHAEDLDIQNRSLPLFKKYTSEQTHEYAIKHQVIIERFGHFPHRNAILGRPLNDEEVEFLKSPDSSF